MTLPQRKFHSIVHGSELDRYKGDAREDLIQRLTPQELKAYTDLSVTLNAEIIAVIRQASLNRQILMAYSRNLTASIELDTADYAALKQQFDQPGDNRFLGSSSSVSGRGYLAGHRKETSGVGDTVYPTQIISIQVKYSSGTRCIFSEML